MYYADLTPYEYNLPRPLGNVFNIGWLDDKHPFPKGKVSKTFIEQIIRSLRFLTVNRMRGVHVCEICFLNGEIGQDQRIYSSEDKTIMLGSSELWFPGKHGAIYAAPNLILHYIQKHQYVPPPEFIDAVLEYNWESCWDAVQERNKLVGDIFRR